MYVVDSIARQYQEQARRQGQDISTTTDDRTFAGGLRHITSVLPSLMNDILQHAPDSQKVIALNIFKTQKKRNVRKYTFFQKTYIFYGFVRPSVNFRPPSLFPPLFCVDG